MSILTSVGLASTAGMMAVTFTHPVELTKTRLQLDQELVRRTATAKPTYRGWCDCLLSTLKKDGLRGLQRGLSAALMREAVFNGVRIGLYDPLLALASSQRPHPTDPPSFGLKLMTGLGVGALASAVCNPLDILKVRLQSQGGKTGFQHTGYTRQGVLGNLRRLFATEGIAGMFKGVSVNATRGILGPGTQLPIYNALKEVEPLHQWLHTERDGWQKHTVCALGSAAVSIFCVNPIDVIRTRLYNQPCQAAVNASGGASYRHGTDAAMKILSHEGPMAFYKGGLTHFGRLGPHMVLVFVFLEQLKQHIG